MSVEINVSNPKLTALYCRVSTQDQHTGLESQVRVLKEYCERFNIKNYEFFSDEGISGAKTSRPGLDRMMALARENKLERVVCYSFSRYARSVTHLLTALEEFRKLNVAFVSYTESVDTNSPMGRAFFTLIAAISQLERELIQERVKNGIRNAKAKGIHIGRIKTRPSALIRQLLEQNLPYRTIASVCNTSHGSVWAEKQLWLKEKEELKRKEALEARMRGEGDLHVLDDSTPWLQNEKGVLV